MSIISDKILTTIHLENRKDDYQLSNYDFSNFYWIGGAACGGKSTLATFLSKKHNITLYKCDQHSHARKAKSNPMKSPMLFELKSRPLEDVLLSTSLEKQLDEYIAFLQDDFELLMKDLTNIPNDKPVIVEGNQLLPHLLPNYINDLHRAIWITPTIEFFNQHFFKREWILDKVKICSNPQQALENWTQRNILFTQWIDKTANEKGLTLFKTPIDLSLQERAQQIEKHFHLL